jgi:hypothetical protein
VTAALAVGAVLVVLTDFVAAILRAAAVVTATLAVTAILIVIAFPIATVFGTGSIVAATFAVRAILVVLALPVATAFGAGAVVTAALAVWAVVVDTALGADPVIVPDLAANQPGTAFEPRAAIGNHRAIDEQAAGFAEPRAAFFVEDAPALVTDLALIAIGVAAAFLADQLGFDTTGPERGLAEDDPWLANPLHVADVAILAVFVLAAVRFALDEDVFDGAGDAALLVLRAGTPAGALDAGLARLEGVAILIVAALFDAFHDQIGCGADHTADLAGTPIDALVHTRVTGCARIVADHRHAHATAACLARIAVLIPAAPQALALTAKQSCRAICRAFATVRRVILQVLAPARTAGLTLCARAHTLTSVAGLADIADDRIEVAQALIARNDDA